MKAKKTITLLSIIFVIVLHGNSLLAQWSTISVNGNTLPGNQNNILGTSNAATNTVGKRDIRFFTFGFERMRLIGEPNNVPNNIGFLGLGLQSPQSLVHLHNNTTPSVPNPQVVYSQWTIDGVGTGTGNTANDGFRIGVRSFFNTNTSAFESWAQLIQQENFLYI